MSEQKRLDRPDREKIESLTELICGATHAWLLRNISYDEFDLYDDYVTDQILDLIPDCEQKVKEAIDTAIGAYESTCEALIEEAKKQERDKWLNFVDWLDNGLRSSAGWRTEIRKFTKALKEENKEESIGKEKGKV